MSDAIITPESRKRLHEFIDKMLDSQETTGCMIQCSFFNGYHSKNLFIMKGCMQDTISIEVLLKGLQKMLSNIPTAKASAIRCLIGEVQKTLLMMVAKDIEATSAATGKTEENVTWH